MPFDLIVFDIPQFWDEGVGFDYEYSNNNITGNKTYDTRASNWFNRISTSGWTTPGIYTGNTPIGTIHFDNGNEDINVDITFFPYIYYIRV